MKYASNASRLHKKVGEALAATSPFKAYTLQQEVAVSSLFSEYTNNRDRYDWVVPKLKLVIECHGIQHYKFQTFGADAEKALQDWRESLRRDERKRQIAVDNGWTFIEVPYTDEKVIDGAYLFAKFNKEYNDQEPVTQEREEKSDWKTEARDKQLALGKAARARQYQYLKQLKEKFKSEDDN